MRVNQRFAKNAELDMHFLGAKGNTQFDGFPGSPNQADFMQQVAGLGLNFSPATNWNVSLKGGDYKDKYESFRNNSPSVSRQVFDTDRRTLTWQNNILLPHDQILTAGMDLTRDSVDSTTQFSTTKRDNIGAYLQTQYSFYRQDLLLGLRYDDNDSFGNYTTSNIAWGFKFNHRIRLYTSYGTAFKAPTFNDLYYPDVGYYKGNPDLNPENSRSFEVGLTGKTDSSHWNIRFYHTNIDNLIVYFTDENFVGTMQNVDRARIKGLEASYSKRVGYWQLSTTLSLVDPKNLQTAKALPGRARKTVKFNLEHQNGKTVTGLTILAQDYRYDGVTGDKIPGYGITNFYTRYPLGKNWILHGRINNLFDKRYETVEFYNEPRRNAFISIAYQL